MKGLYFAAIAMVAASTTLKAADSNDAKYQEDKATILKMAGCYRVDFSFGETFSPDTAYKYHDRKFEYGTEYVTVVENDDKKISLQHLLLVGDGMIVKHWRQDWVYQNATVFNYDGDNVWKKNTIPAAKVKGTWTQKVYQVDDGPRYEGYGTWVHVDGRHFWESTTDAPLPRREYTTRNDYNVVKRRSHIEVTDSTWVLDQDNDKIIRKDGKDKLLVSEKGIEAFSKGDGKIDCQEGVDYWKKNEAFWADVRSVWDGIYQSKSTLKLKEKVDGKALYSKLFALEGKANASGKYNSKETLPEIKAIINSFVEN